MMMVQQSYLWSVTPNICERREAIFSQDEAQATHRARQGGIGVIMPHRNGIHDLKTLSIHGNLVKTKSIYNR